MLLLLFAGQEKMVTLQTTTSTDESKGQQTLSTAGLLNWMWINSD